MWVSLCLVLQCLGLATLLHAYKVCVHTHTQTRKAYGEILKALHLFSHISNVAGQEEKIVHDKMFGLGEVSFDHGFL